jgi:LEA14-like dessication related protein
MTKKAVYIVLLILLSCCADFKDIEIGDPEGIRITGMKGNVVDLEMKIPVSNPRAVGFRIKEIDIKTSVNNSYLGRLSSDGTVVIPPKSNEIHNLRLKLRIANIIQGITLLLDIMNNKNIELQMEGYIKFKSLMIGRKINVEETLYVNSFNK